MGVDRSGGPVVDPTRNVLDLVTAAIARQDDLRVEGAKLTETRAKANRDYIDGQIEVLVERLRGIDHASAILAESVDKIPEAAISKLRELMDERFVSIETQFKERDTRQERESRDNKVAVDAAFAAQKEAAAKQEETFSKSIDKSELATAETISKLQALTTTQDKGLSDKIDDLKERVQRIESLKAGAVESVRDHRESNGTLIAIAGLALSAVVVVVTLAAAGVFGP